jgi:hypothetical protein
VRAVELVPSEGRNSHDLWQDPRGPWLTRRKADRNGQDRRGAAGSGWQGFVYRLEVAIAGMTKELKQRVALAATPLQRLRGVGVAARLVSELGTRRGCARLRHGQH